MLEFMVIILRLSTAFDAARIAPENPAHLGKGLKKASSLIFFVLGSRSGTGGSEGHNEEINTPLAEKRFHSRCCSFPYVE